VKSVRPLDGVQEAVTFPMPKGLDGLKRDVA
jgi:4-hydroxy-3-methylbut-2-enyl diphosphate reductase